MSAYALIVEPFETLAFMRAALVACLALALANGATDEGAPGERMPGFYGAYFRDLDGNKVCVFKMG